MSNYIYMASFTQLLKSRQIVNTTNIDINAETIDRIISDISNIDTLTSTHTGQIGSNSSDIR